MDKEAVRIANHRLEALVGAFQRGMPIEDLNPIAVQELKELLFAPRKIKINYTCICGGSYESKDAACRHWDVCEQNPANHKPEVPNG